MLSTQPDTYPVTTAPGALADAIEHLRLQNRPIALTVHGQTAAILQDPAEYQRLLDIAALNDPREGIRQGLEQLRRGEGRPASEFFTELREKYGISR
jgi:PHD/YefM family antitoxin component YafN of YafNO toxin-antitoxin module